MEDPGYRNVTFDELAAAYGEAAKGLLVGGADILLVETVFDTLNAQAALYAIDEVFAAQGFRRPVCDLSRGATPDDIFASTAIALALG